MGVDAEHGQMVGWPDTRFLELVGSELPIVQAPMTGAGGVPLCLGAMEGGALGSLPCALLSPAQIGEQAAAVRARSDRPFNLNFFCHTMPESVDDGAWRSLLQPYYDEYGAVPGMAGMLRMPFDEAACAVVEEVRPKVVSFHFGLPEQGLLRRVKESGAIVLGTATTPVEARWLDE